MLTTTAMRCVARRIISTLLALIKLSNEITKAEVGFILHVDHDRNEMYCQENKLYTVGTDHAK